MLCNRQIKSYMSQTMLTTLHYAPFHSITSYGIIFWGKSTRSSKKKGTTAKTMAHT
jgi:hypothetical protein